MADPAVILLAHGSRDARWQAPFERLAGELVASRGPGAVRLAYLGGGRLRRPFWGRFFAAGPPAARRGGIEDEW